MRSEDEQGKPYFYNPSDSTTQWELPQVPVTGKRYQSCSKTSQTNDSLTLASPPEAKSKTLDKAGVLYCTKTAEKGKRLRKKNWSSSWTVLEGGILTFFKESKASTAGSLRQPSNLSTPEYTVDLRGATLNWATKNKSSKKNVLERQSRDNQVFGCVLSTLCERENSLIPGFGQQCIRTVESRGLDIDRLYRISGNMATIQKLLYKVDHDERLDLDDGCWEDVHVITGALKLFFWELFEPLFPFSHFYQFISAIKLSDQAKQSCHVWDLVHSLPAPNRNTMHLLFQYLCRVIEHKEENHMSVQSVAIVFGPMLLPPEFEEGSMPVTMVFQNQVVELILQQCRDIFPQR
uniref:Rho GTPase activating protein 27 n=1 Tax=Monodelphis domestica TaxID=13616 RepID=F6UJT4_MONDO